MSVKVTIGSQVISFPVSGDSANWAPAVTAFAIAVSQALAGIASAFDIPPSVQVLTNDTNTNLNINNAIFPSDVVRSFVFSYAIYRTNGVGALAESGSVNGVFNTISSTWYLEQEFQGERQDDGAPFTTFNMSGDQLQISTFPIGGAYDGVNSKLSYSGRTILTSDI